MSTAVGKKFLCHKEFGKKTKSKRSLRILLSELGIAVLVESTLKDYKKYKVSQAAVRFRRLQVFTKMFLWADSLTARIFLSLLACTGIVFITCSISFLLLSLVSAALKLIFNVSALNSLRLSLPIIAESFKIYALQILVAIVVLYFVERIIKYKLQVLARNHPRIIWEMIPLNSYLKLENVPAVPKIILDLVSEISIREPQLETHIEYTKPVEFVKIGSESFLSNFPDPIVRIKLRKESFGIAVFDESGSEIPYYWL